MLGHKTVVDADPVGACRRLGLDGGLCEHRTENRHESQPQVAQYSGAWVHLICALWVHCNHPEPSQSEVCLSPTALRDPTRAVSWLESVFYHSPFSVYQQGQVPFQEGKAAPIQRQHPNAHVA